MRVKKRKDIFLLGGVPAGQEVRCLGQVNSGPNETWIALSSTNGLKYACRLEIGARSRLVPVGISEVVDIQGDIRIATTGGTLVLQSDGKAFWNGIEVTVHQKSW